MPGCFALSPSSVATMAPRAARTLLRTAADCPAELACCSCLRFGRTAMSALLRGRRVRRAVVQTIS